MTNTKYKSAIEHRRKAIEKLKANPPEDWTPEYIEKTIKEIEKQINTLENLD